MAIIADRRARIIGKAESGRLFGSKQENAIVPPPTTNAGSTEYHTPGAVEVWFQCPTESKPPRYRRMLSAAVASTTNPPGRSPNSIGREAW